MPSATNPAYASMPKSAAIGLLLVMALIAALTFRDYGITHDEEVQRIYGELLVRYYASGLTDKSAFAFLDLYRYGGFFDLVAALVQPLSPFPVHETRHLLGGAFGVFGAAGAWMLGRFLGGERAGLIGLALAATTPALYGHMFNNPKDGPFAASMIWALYYTSRIIVHLPHPRLSDVLKFGATFGLAMSIRVGALLLPFYLGAGVLIHLLAGEAATETSRSAITRLAAIVLRLAPALPVAVVLTGIFWPWSLQAPGNVLLALHDFQRIPLEIETLYDGRWIKAAELPPAYLPHYLLITLPETALLGAGIALFLGAAAAWGAFRKGKVLSPTANACLVIFIAAAFPVLFFMFTTPLIYNGMRHFLFVIPPICVLAGLAIDRLFVLLDGHRVTAFAAQALLILLLASQAWRMTVLHPNQYIFFNVIAGGVRGADGAFELDYWGNSLREATLLLRDRLEREGEPGVVYRIAVCGHRTSSETYFSKKMKFTTVLPEADFLIAFTQRNCDRNFAGEKIISVERAGAILAVVKDRRGVVDAR